MKMGFIVKMTTYKRVIILLWSVFMTFALSFAQVENDVIDMKDPITGKWGYACKIQNRKSPLKGIKKLAVSSFGKTGSALMSKEDAEAIDWIIPPLYDAVAPEFSEQLAGVEVGGLVGFIDIYNRFIIEPRYEPTKNLSGFKLGLAAVKIGEKYGFVNKMGETVISPVFDYAENFKDNMLAVVKQNGKYGAIDLNGNIVVPCKFAVEAAMVTVPISNKPYKNACDSVKKEFQNQAYSKVCSQLKACNDKVQQRISDSLWIQSLVTSPMGEGDAKGLKDNYGRVIIPCQFSSITYDQKNHLYIVKDALNRSGVYTYKGDRLFHPLFDSIGTFSNGQSVASVDGIQGVIDAHGWVDPSFMDDICNMGLQHDTNGDVAKARSLYERILSIDPNHVMALNNLAIIDINNKDYNKGMRKLKLANKLAPENELISENLHAAKKNRNERRWNRINTGLEIAAAIITIGVATYSAVNGGQSSPSSGLTSSEAMSSGSYDDGFSSAGGKSKGSTSSNSKASLGNWRALDRAYSGYEDQLMRMKSSGNYDKQEVRDIQNKMKDIRDKIYKQSGGHQRAASSIESWNP